MSDFEPGEEKQPEVLVATKRGLEKSRESHEYEKSGKQPFDELNEAIIRGELPDDVLQEKITERDRRYQELKDMGVVDIVRSRIGRTLGEIAEWDKAPDAIEGFSDEIEEETLRREGIEYRNKPYLHGMVRAMTLGAAKYVSLQGFENIVDDEEALKRNNMTRRGVERLREQVEREHFMDFGYDPFQKLNDAVAKRRKKEEEEKFYRRMGDEGKQVPTPTRATERQALPSQLPDHYGAVFESSKYRQYAFDWYLKGDVVPVLDITESEQRSKWLFENMRVFTDGTVPDPENHWHQVLTSWITDLRGATGRYIESKYKDASEEDKKEKEMEKRGLFEGSGQDEGVKGTEMDMKALMAVSASARAMEVSAGSGAKYVSLIAPPGPGERGADLDKQDSWHDIIIHNNPDAYNRVIDNPHVRHYYEILLKDAGITIAQEPSKGGNSDFTTDPEGIEDKNLIKYLRNKAEAGGLDAWIAATIEEEDSGGESPGWDSSVRWAAAKSACDAFLVDKFTRWDYDLTKKRGKDYGTLYPSENWGGDPLRSVLEPSFLTRKVKKMYTEADSEILDMVDEAFRPDDIVDEDNLVPATMVGHLKNYARYSDALFTYLGGSRGPEIPAWTRDVMGKSLPRIVELLDTVYGDRTFKDKRGDDMSGKEVMGAMVARALECKALATTAEAVRPGWSDNLNVLFDGEGKERPFYEVLRFLWGDKLDNSGFLASCEGSRTRIVFENNLYAEPLLEETWSLLKSNDQEKAGRETAKALNRLGFGLDVIQAFDKNFGGKRR